MIKGRTVIGPTGSIAERHFLSSLRTLWVFFLFQKRQRASATQTFMCTSAELLPLCQKVQEGTTQQVSDGRILKAKVSVKSKNFLFSRAGSSAGYSTPAVTAKFFRLTCCYLYRTQLHHSSETRLLTWGFGIAPCLWKLSSVNNKA